MRSRREDGERKQLQYFLVVTSSDGGVHTHPVTDEPITVGRSPLATICVAEVAVSRQHCVVTSTGGRLTILDQGSTNGTFVNGARVKQARLSHSDVVQVGSTRIRVQAQTARTSKQPKLVAAPSHQHLRAPLPHEQLALVQRAVAKMAVSTSVEAAAAAALDLMLEAFPVDRAYVLLCGEKEDGGAPRVIASVARDGEEADASDVSQPVVERVIGTGQAERHLAAAAETAPALAADMKLKSSPILCAPLRMGGRVFGAAYLSAAALPEWAGTGEMLSLLNAIADAAALAIGRARSTTELEEQARLAEDRQSELSDLGRDLERRVRQRTEVIEEQSIELTARLDELEHLQNSRAALARGLVHDIRNLVGALHSNLSFVRGSLEEGSEEHAALDDAIESGRRIVSMAKDVLAASRMEDGTFPLATEAVDGGTLVWEAVRRNGGLAREIGATLELATVDAELVIGADPDVIGRVLDNLVGNALRYAGKDGHVSLSALRVSGAAELVVTDSGPGVRPEERERIFTEWYRSGGTSSRHHGIGLHFCSLAAQAHGGSIRVEGTRGDNRFVVRIPAVDRDEDTGPVTVDKE